MSEGLVYILTNPCLEGWVKIGMTGRTTSREDYRNSMLRPIVRFHFGATPFMRWRTRQWLKKIYLVLLTK